MTMSLAPGGGGYDLIVCGAQEANYLGQGTGGKLSEFMAKISSNDMKFVDTVTVSAPATMAPPPPRPASRAVLTLRRVSATLGPLSADRRPTWERATRESPPTR